MKRRDLDERAAGCRKEVPKSFVPIFRRAPIFRRDSASRKEFRRTQERLRPGALKPQLLHSILERRSFHSQPRRRAIWPANNPVGRFERAKDVFAFGDFERGYIRGGGLCGWFQL